MLVVVVYCYMNFDSDSVRIKGVPDVLADVKLLL